MTDRQQKVAFLKFIILLTLVAIAHMLTSCDKTELEDVKPIHSKPIHTVVDTLTKYGELPPIYLPPVIDTSNGEPWVLVRQISVGFPNSQDLDTLTWTWDRPLWRWQEEDFPWFYEGIDSTWYELDQDPYWIIVEAKTHYPFAD